ncbi:MAG: hypothetical protein KAH77_00440 [Thiomargarita sp.]|nr:hypothetical protein [Thiomargarita sp.]
MLYLSKIIILGLTIALSMTAQSETIAPNTVQSETVVPNTENTMGTMGKNKRGNGKHKPTFAEFDLNADGKILEDEFYKARDQRIAKRAKQGYQMRNLAHAPSFVKIDLNGDKQITPKEFTKHLFQCGKHKQK